MTNIVNLTIQKHLLIYLTKSIIVFDHMYPMYQKLQLYDRAK
jgi:hypothetical protein